MFRLICRGGPLWPPQSFATRIIRKMGRPQRAAPTIALMASIILLSVGKIGAHETFTGFMEGIRANAVKGDVVYQREDAKLPLEPALKLDPGDIVKTSPNACAELLLQPGNYLRLAGDTELQIVNDQHDRMKFKLNRGSTSFEILSREDVRNSSERYDTLYLIRVIVPGTEVFIMEPGIFRINTRPDQTELVVRKGSAVIKGNEIKEKRRAVVSGDNVSINEAGVEDSFDAWARERAETQVRANKSLKKESLWSRKKENEEASVDLPQDEERSGSPLIVSAKPGTVNFAEEDSEFSRAPNEWQQLTEKTPLEAGDRLRTAANSFTELELFPDIYFRLGASSECLLEQLSNDAVSIRLVKGSAILDAVLFDRRQSAQIMIAAGTTAATIIESGNFRLDDNAVTVRRGKVRFNERSVGSCHQIAAGVVSDCDRKHPDNFDYWSQYAGEGKYFRGVSMTAYFEKSRRTRFRNTGFWFQNPDQTSYAFVPFTSDFFNSPYGGHYSTVLSPRRRIQRLNRSNIEDRLPQLSGPPSLPSKP